MISRYFCCIFVRYVVGLDTWNSCCLVTLTPSKNVSFFSRGDLQSSFWVFLFIFILECWAKWQHATTSSSFSLSSSIEKIRHGSQKRIILKILLTSLEKQDIKLSTQHHLINSFFHFSGKTNNLTKPNSTQHKLIKPSLERLLKVT